MVIILAMLSALILALPLALQAAPDPAKPGPYRVDDKDEGRCTVFAPAELSGRLPVILWGNGSQAPVGIYAPILRHLASHGFVVAAAKTGAAGSGQEMLGCLDHLTAKSRDPQSFWYEHLDLTKVGTTGHSQGANGALAAGRDPRVTATAPLQPAARVMRPEFIAAQHAPMLLLSGGADRVAVPEFGQAPIFAGVKSPVVWATLKAAGHSTPGAGGGGPYRGALAAWFRWKLMSDEGAGAWFEGEACGLCRDRAWEVRRR